MNYLPMARVALRNLLTKPATRRYPAEIREPFAATRGRIDIDFPVCIFCGACQRHCPAGSIAVSRPEASWRIDRLSCVICGSCVAACPKKCLVISPQRQKPVSAADTSPAVEQHRKSVAPRPPALEQGSLRSDSDSTTSPGADPASSRA